MLCLLSCIIIIISPNPLADHSVHRASTETVDVLGRFFPAVAGTNNASVSVDESQCSTLHIGQYASLTLPTQQAVGPRYRRRWLTQGLFYKGFRREDSAVLRMLDSQMTLQVICRRDASQPPPAAS